MEVYLDHAATTWCCESVKEIVARTMVEDYGNPSSMHKKGVEAEGYVKRAKEIIARQLKAKEKEIYFTSGGTESNNLAIFGTAMANKRNGKRIVSTAIEHAAVREPVKRLEELGFETVILPVDSQGGVSVDALEEALNPDTILVSVMYVNNETGSVQPVERIAGIIHEKAPGALFHVDAIQAFGKYRIYPGRMGIDLMSVSGHKIHGPKGTGFLYVREQSRIQPQILGGGQQGGMRSGTDNVPGIAGLGAAVEEIYRDFDQKTEHMYQMKELLAQGLARMEGVLVNGMDVRLGAPHIVSASFMGIRSEVLLHALEDKGIYISAGSACSTHKRAGSSTLTAMGMKPEQRESTVRFSLCEETSQEEIEYCLEILGEIVPVLKRYARR